MGTETGTAYYTYAVSSTLGTSPGIVGSNDEAGTNQNANQDAISNHAGWNKADAAKTSADKTRTSDSAGTSSEAGKTGYSSFFFAEVNNTCSTAARTDPSYSISVCYTAYAGTTSGSIETAGGTKTSSAGEAGLTDSSTGSAGNT